MSGRVVCDVSISADGYVAGPNQTADKPSGSGRVDRMHSWMFDRPDENQAEVDQIVAAGAFVMGGNRTVAIAGGASTINQYLAAGSIAGHPHQLPGPALSTQ